MSASFESSKYTIYPIQYPKIWEHYKIAQQCFWTAEEIDLSSDILHWKQLRPEEQSFLKNVLAFFAASDGIVNENLALRFFDDIPIPEVRAFYGFQIAMENIHGETYSLLIDTFVENPDEKHRLFNGIETIPAIKKKAEWALQYINSTEDFSTRLIAFACVEGIHFSSSFCSIFNLKKRGLMPGLTFSNEMISRDEGLHTNFACLLYNTLVEDKIDVLPIIISAVNVEIEFVNDALKVDLIGMNAVLMGEYVKFCADRLLLALEHEKHYNAKNPFPWMELISLEGKTNFFERRVGEYAKTRSERTFKMDEDF